MVKFLIIIVQIFIFDVMKNFKIAENSATICILL